MKSDDGRTAAVPRLRLLAMIPHPERATSAHAGTPCRVALEGAAQAFADAMAVASFEPELGPVEGRRALDRVQSTDIERAAVRIDDTKTFGVDEIPVRILRPVDLTRPPVILYLHGPSWVAGNKHTHDRLMRELATRVGAAIVFPSFSLSPEARYPTAVDQSYAVLRWITENGPRIGIDSSRVVVAGDSAGANLSIALTLIAKQRDGPRPLAQALFYPVTDCRFDTASYEAFAEGYHLRRETMKWRWDQYTTDEDERAEITASPLRATLDQLSGLPRALIITAEADVLRDEGEAYASKLSRAGVEVTATRYDAVIHDFMVLDALRGTHAAQAAIALAVSFISDAFSSSTPPHSDRPSRSTEPLDALKGPQS
jgi:acetyl esterase